MEPEVGPRERQLYEYVRRCEEWNERVRTAIDLPPSSDELEHFGRVLSPTLWEIQMRDGSRAAISEPPVFFVGDELTWRP